MPNRMLGFFIFILLVIALTFAVVLLAAAVDPAGAASECWPGCPHPPLRPQIWLPIVQQCKGAYCDLGGWGEAPAK